MRYFLQRREMHRSNKNKNEIPIDDDDNVCDILNRFIQLYSLIMSFVLLNFHLATSSKIPERITTFFDHEIFFREW